MSWAARDFDAFSMASAGDGAAATAHAAVTPLSVVRRLTGGERGASAAAAWTRSAVTCITYVFRIQPDRVVVVLLRDSEIELARVDEELF